MHKLHVPGSWLFLLLLSAFSASSDSFTKRKKMNLDFVVFLEGCGAAGHGARLAKELRHPALSLLKRS